MRAAIYVRQSLDRAGEGAAVTRQEAECRELADRNDWDVARVYSDNDKSASNGKPRPGWTELLSALRDGQYDVLVCWHTDRLYRRLRDLVELVEIAEKRSLRIASVRATDLDLSTPAGRMLAGMLGTAARYEVEQKSARQVAANRARAQRGHVGWSRRPYGYTRQDGAVVLVDTEAAILREAADRALSGESMASIVRDLNDRGITTSLGGDWSVTTLRRQFLNPRHGGRAVSLGHDYGAASWPAIFDEQTADRLAAMMRDPSRRTTTETGIKYLLSGIAICGACGDTMYATPAGSPTGGQWTIYRCKRQHLGRRLDLVDEVVEAAVVARLSQPDAAGLFDTADADTLDSLRAQLVELRDRRDGLAGLLADGLLPPSAAREQAEKLSAQIGALEEQLQRASSSSAATTLAVAPDVASAWASLDLRSRRDVIRTLMTVTIEKAGRGARFTPDQVRIDWVAT